MWQEVPGVECSEVLKSGAGLPGLGSRPTPQLLIRGCVLERWRAPRGRSSNHLPARCWQWLREETPEPWGPGMGESSDPWVGTGGLALLLHPKAIQQCLASCRSAVQILEVAGPMPWAQLCDSQGRQQGLLGTLSLCFNSISKYKPISCVRHFDFSGCQAWFSDANVPQVSLRQLPGQGPGAHLSGAAPDLAPLCNPSCSASKTRPARLEQEQNYSPRNV